KVTGVQTCALPIWMIGKARDVVLGLVGAELIEHQERIEVGELWLPDHPREPDACAIGGRHAGHDTLHRAGSNLRIHGTFLLRSKPRMPDRTAARTARERASGRHRTAVGDRGARGAQARGALLR